MKKENLLLLLLFTCAQLTAQVEKPVRVLAGGQPITTENCKGIIHASSYDWNKDGKKDLIVGEFTGKSPFRVYLNIGTDKKPKFDSDFFYGKNQKGEKLVVKTG